MASQKHGIRLYIWTTLKGRGHSWVTRFQDTWPMPHSTFSRSCYFIGVWKTFVLYRNPFLIQRNGIVWVGSRWSRSYSMTLASSKHQFHCPYQCLLFQPWGSSWSSGKRTVFFTNSPFLSLSPLTPKFSNFIEVLEVEQGMDHTVHTCSSALPSTRIFSFLGAMEYGIFQTMDFVHEIIHLCRNYILQSSSSPPCPQHRIFCFGLVF